MTCNNCARTTLSLFIRSFVNSEQLFAARRPILHPQQSRFLTDARRPRKASIIPTAEPPKADPEIEVEDALTGELERKNERPAWAVQKEALKEKLGGEAWNPRKKLSPDTMEGIRHLHSTQPDKFTTPVLAEHFKVSPEAIRRILKSKWRPSDEEYEARMERWNKRGERIWSNLVEMGIKPPKKWREMGVGRTEDGEMPRWKSRNRNQVGVRDSINDNFKDYIPDEDLIPTVDKSGRSKPTTSRVPLSERL
ncbi:Required for respiratory growth protein 9 [Alternaria tenuissima]|uniref:Required for respiratory growth protein 9, mitochondrial n=1 Tax=Alternaria tenuissima TaxID=119927 RepID=A0AB37WLA6_9PLEO|nr:Required for respiratory growth protein 9 [Alternaria tenuissima]RYO07259.1 Required for respiratory growth protein 9 [Alternaria tenuissima]RYO20357.1 Required for respiratory growth protein 9 [Alternaria tenuissima]